MPKSQTNYDRRKKINNKSDNKLSAVVDPQRQSNRSARVQSARQSASSISHTRPVIGMTLYRFPRQSWHSLEGIPVPLKSPQRKTRLNFRPKTSSATPR
jgi:hypothetical protein